jgi:hypothetical protein
MIKKIDQDHILKILDPQTKQDFIFLRFKFLLIKGFRILKNFLKYGPDLFFLSFFVNLSDFIVK